MTAELIKQIILDQRASDVSISIGEAEALSNKIFNHLNYENSFFKNPGGYEKAMYHATQEICEETLNAKKMFPKNFTNQHEAYAVILEEVEELWAEIKKNKVLYDLKAQRKEAIQAAAMLVRFIVELTKPQKS